MFGAVTAVATSFGIHVLFGVNSARKNKSETTDAAQVATAAAGNGGDGEGSQRTTRQIQSGTVHRRYWYLWTGVCLLVVGLGYGLMLAYEHVGPLVKIISWFAGAAALVVAGEYAQRKMDFKQFGLALVGGGYAVGYFTIYAMQNIASVKIIDSVVVDSCLLLALAASCMLHSMYRKSESIALLASLLAFVTLSLSPVTSFTVVASAVMVIGLAAATIYMRWFMVYLAGVIGSYVTFVLFTQPQLAASVTGAQGLLLSFGFLAAYWLVFSLVHLRIRQPEETDGVKRFTIAAAILNAGAFIFLALSAMGAEFADWRYLFLLFTSAAYGTFAYVSRAKNLAFSGTLFTLIALGAATAAVPLWLSPNAVTAVWLLEVPILVVAGLRFRMLELRGFAVAVAVLAVARLFAGDILGLSYQLVTGLTAVFAFAVSAQAYRLQAFEAAQHKYENLFARYFYLAAAAVVAWWMPLVLAGPATQGLYWALAGAGFTGIRVLHQRTRGRVCDRSHAGIQRRCVARQLPGGRNPVHSRQRGCILCCRCYLQMAPQQQQRRTGAQRQLPPGLQCGGGRNHLGAYRAAQPERHDPPGPLAHGGKRTCCRSGLCLERPRHSPIGQLGRARCRGYACP